MGEATKGEGFSSSLVYVLIKISACGTIVRVNPEKICTGGDKFLYYNLTDAQSVCTRLSFPSRPAPSGEPGFEASMCTYLRILFNVYFSDSVCSEFLDDVQLIRYKYCVSQAV